MVRFPLRRLSLLWIQGLMALCVAYAPFSHASCCQIVERSIPNFQEEQANLHLARQYYYQKEYTLSDQILKEILAQNPGSLEARALMKRVQLKIAQLIEYAKSQDRQGEPCLPKEIYNQLVAAFPRSPRPLILMGQHYHMLQENVRAESYFLQALALNPMNTQVQGALAQFYLDAGLPLLAHREVERILKKQPKEDDALNLVDEMEDMAKDKADVGEKLFKEKKYQEAMVLYQQAVELDPDNREYLDKLGTLYMLQLRMEEAEEVFDHLLCLDTTDYYVRVSLIRVYLGQDKYREARHEIEIVRKETKLDSETFAFLENAQIDAQIKEAQALTKCECYCEAIAIYLRLIEEDHINRDYFTALGSLYMRIDDECRAKYYLLKTLYLYPDDEEAKTLLATLYFRQKNYLEAQNELNEVLCKTSYNTDADFLQARLLQVCHRDKESEEYYKKALFTDVNRSDIRRSYGSYLAKYNRYCEAYQQFAAAWEREGENEDLDRLIGLRPFIRPSLKMRFVYSREKEKDLVTKRYVALLRNREYFEQLTLPVVYNLHPYLFFGYEPNLQVNLQQKRNSYNVDILRYGVGFKAYWRDLLTFKVESRTRDGKGRRNVIFPFEEDKLWEPSLLIRYHPKKHRLSFFGGKDAFIGRNVSKTTSIFVKTKEALGVYEFLFSPPHSALGVEGKKMWYEAVKDNQKKEFSGWARYAILKKPLYLILEYRARRGLFDLVVDSYTSYKRRDEQHFKITFLKNWGARASAELYYLYSKETWRDFVQQATIFTAPVNTALKVNRFEGHTVEAILKKVLRDAYHFEVSGKWYKNTDDYRTISAKISFQWVF